MMVLYRYRYSILLYVYCIGGAQPWWYCMGIGVLLYIV